MGWKQAPGSVKDQGLLSTEMVDTHAQIMLIRSRKGYSVRVLWAARLLTVSAEARKSMSKSDLQLGGWAESSRSRPPNSSRSDS